MEVNESYDEGIDGRMPAPIFTLKKPLLLASASPRRQRLLASLGIDCPAYPAAIDETRLSGEKGENYVRRLAEAKAQVVAGRFPESFVLAADTVVCQGRRVLGKPSSPVEAARMLASLAGKTHRVLTGYYLTQKISFMNVAGCVVSRVRFAAWDAASLTAYAACGEPLDKAGAYGIQGAGAFLVAGISGSPTNVIGLPLAEIVSLFMRLGIIAPATSSLGE